MSYEDELLKKQLNRIMEDGKLDLRKEALNSLEELDKEKNELEEKLEAVTSEQERGEIENRLKEIDMLIAEFENLDRWVEEVEDEMAVN